MNEEGINSHLISLIDKIKPRPQLYIGKKSCSLLFAYIDGFMNGMKIYEPNLDIRLYGYFNFWLGKKYNDNRAFNWANLILEKEKDEEKACDKFFIEFEEYLNETKNWKKTNEIIRFLEEKFCDLKECDNSNIYIEIKDYPNNYVTDYYEKNCYNIQISYREICSNKNYQIVWRNFYVNKDLDEIWVFNKKLGNYITIEEFSCSEEYQAFPINDIPRLT